MKRLVKEPLLHFLVLGAAIFAVYHWLPNRSSDEPGKIVITQGQIEHLATAFAKSWQRPPTAEELAGLVRDRVREEVYCREAMALGLDREDTVIRRRLRQKMEFVSDDIVAQSEPSDADLNTYLHEHPDSFRFEQRFTFRQVYLNPEKHGQNLARDAAQLLAQLNQAGGKAEVSAVGDSSLLEGMFKSVPASEVATQFGEKFAARLDELSPGRWQGPVESSYGMHLVFVEERTKGRVPELAEVRDAVSRDWTNERRLELNEKFFQGLLKHYEVVVEKIDPAKGDQKFANAK
jgi:PPIC-type PPIASE domain